MMIYACIIMFCLLLFVLVMVYLAYHEDEMDFSDKKYIRDVKMIFKEHPHNTLVSKLLMWKVALVHIKNGNHNNRRVCTEVRNKIKLLIKKQYVTDSCQFFMCDIIMPYELETEYKHYSGSFAYPVSGDDCEINNDSLWSGENKQKRLDLIDLLLKKINLILESKNVKLDIRGE